MKKEKIIELALSCNINMFGPRILTEVFGDDGKVTHLEYVEPTEPHYAGREIIKFAALIEKEVLNEQ